MIEIRTGAEVLSTHVLEYIFEILILLEISHVLILVLAFNVLKLYEYITGTSEYFLNDIVKII